MEISTVDSVEWRGHNDLKQTFPLADYVGDGRYVFNIKGNGYRIVAVANNARKTLYINENGKTIV
ncbi:MAG: type II toxin-antitoxin system HigB family toxin [Dysgonamonadaceae bacterium]|jgi:mRNA interferase HigB|nr:type II toxin-antitoxin system HigB family toxin [Dysgonamonadaceae bacterium]